MNGKKIGYLISNIDFGYRNNDLMIIKKNLILGAFFIDCIVFPIMVILVIKNIYTQV